MSNVQDLLSILGGAGGASNRPTTSRAGGVGATTSGITKTSIDAIRYYGREVREEESSLRYLCRNNNQKSESPPPESYHYHYHNQNHNVSTSTV